VKIYVVKDGLRYGPYSIKELRQELDTGMFKPEHFASLDDCHSWTRINRLPAIAPRSFSVEIDKARNQMRSSNGGGPYDRRTAQILRKGSSVTNAAMHTASG